MVKRQRDAWVEAVGMEDGSWLSFIETSPGTWVADQLPPPDGRMVRWGFLHLDCRPTAYRRIKNGEVRLGENPLVYRLEEFPGESDIYAIPELPSSPWQCPFCQTVDADEKLTTEDVHPKWLLKEYEKRGVRSNWNGFRSRVVRGVTVPVCQDCNNGWMSVIEDDVKELVLSLSLEERRIGPEEFRSLSSWAAVKAVLMDMALGDPLIPSGFAHDLRIRKAPPDGVHVWLVAYSDTNLVIMERKAVRGESGRLLAVAVTFSMARLAFQVIFPTVFGDLSKIGVSDEALVSIWPPESASQERDWPPQFYFDAEAVMGWAGSIHGGQGPDVSTLTLHKTTCVRISREGEADLTRWLDRREWSQVRPALKDREGSGPSSGESGHARE